MCLYFGMYLPINLFHVEFKGLTSARTARCWLKSPDVPQPSPCYRMQRFCFIGVMMENDGVDLSRAL